MDRLFIRFHLKLCIALCIAGCIVRVLLLPLVNKRVNNNFEDFLAGPVTMMAEALHEEQMRSKGPSQLLLRTKKAFRTPVVIQSRHESFGLSDALLERLDRGEVVCERSDGPLARIYVSIAGTDEVLRIGPLRPENPLGEGRGIAVVLVFFIGLSIGIYLLVHPLRKHLASLAQAAESFRLGELSARAVVFSRDAIGDLATSFNRMAEEIQRLIAAQRELLQMVSHELRTPLQRIHFTAAIVRETADSEQRENALTRMECDLHALEELLDELLNYIRLERDVPLQLQAVELNKFIEELIETERELHDGIAISIAKTSTRAIARADLRLLRRALANLIGNAMRHAKTRVELTTQAREGVIYVNIDDDGPGVPPADRQRIFEPFQRLDHVGDQRPRGYGLGLAIVRRIIIRHGGTIEADSAPLGGARFRFSVPA